MSTTQNGKAFEKICEMLPSEISVPLKNLPEKTKEYAEEIRIRKDCPIYITVGKQNFNTDIHTGGEVVEKTFTCLCGGAPYSHVGEIEQGFITTKEGYRIGLGGTTIIKEGKVQFFKNITSLNIRIPKSVAGAADGFFKHYCGGSALIYGPPGSGKTTILKDIIARLDKRVAVIDTRRELFCSNSPMADYLLDVGKADGIAMALKSLFPQVIIFDEIFTKEEAQGVLQGFHCGVPVITTAHACTKDDLYCRPAIKMLIENGAIKYLYRCEDFRGEA